MSGVSPVIISIGVLPAAYFELDTDMFPVSYIHMNPKSYNLRGACFFDTIRYHLCLIFPIEPSEGFSLGFRGEEI